MREVYLADIDRAYRHYRVLAERALSQVDDAGLGVALDGDDNSLAVLMRHVAGNLRSRFTDFLTSDGEKPDRDRDAEFDAGDRVERSALMTEWNAGWDAVLSAIQTLSPADLDRTVRIRGEAFLVPEALSRSVTHTAYHVGQIVFLAKHLAGDSWRSLSIPKGQSNDFGRGSFTEGIVPKS